VSREEYKPRRFKTSFAPNKAAEGRGVEVHIAHALRFRSWGPRLVL